MNKVTAQAIAPHYLHYSSQSLVSMGASTLKVAAPYTQYRLTSIQIDVSGSFERGPREKFAIARIQSASTANMHGCHILVFRRLQNSKMENIHLRQFNLT
jgi:hypothetical protein